MKFGVPATHGHATGGRVSPTYATWSSMVQRCHNSNNPSFPGYGGRGIHVCAEWRTFEGFFRAMGERPEGHSIERIDNDGHYEPGNVRWATAKEQANNRRSSRMVTYEGRTHTTAEWGRETGLGRTFEYRIRTGWAVEDALFIPVGGFNPAHVDFAHGRAYGKKLTADQVARIIELAKSGGRGPQLAKEFGVSPSNISIIARKFGVFMKKGAALKHGRYAKEQA